MTLAAGSLALPGLPRRLVTDDPVVARPLTELPGHHWFGYYDKLQFSPDDRFVLGMETMFEGRTPRADDVIGIGMVDTGFGDRWIEFGTSRAWGWQQGCMLQWRPPDSNEVLWNDREDLPGGSRFVTRVLDVASREKRTLPKPIYAIGPDGRTAVGADFARIQRLRPGYGYGGVEDPFADVRIPRDSGIYRMDVDSGDYDLIVSIADLAAIPFEFGDFGVATHYVNHLLVSPRGDRFIFLHRWIPTPGSPDEERYRNVGGFGTRMFTANMDGSDLFVLDPSGFTSHFIWDDGDHVTAWTRPAGMEPGFYRFRDRTNQVLPVGSGVMTLNGHNSYVPGTDNAWILNDTYPDSADRKQTLYLFHEPTGRRVELGRFLEPEAYRGEWRVDLHPRSSRSGTRICFDSTHEGNGRQLYLVDIADLID